MSSELTIDIQLTELGFSSRDFQLLQQKQTHQTDAGSDIAPVSIPSSPESVQNHEDWEDNVQDNKTQTFGNSENSGKISAEQEGVEREKRVIVAERGDQNNIQIKENGKEDLNENQKVKGSPKVECVIALDDDDDDDDDEEEEEDDDEEEEDDEEEDEEEEEDDKEDDEEEDENEVGEDNEEKDDLTDEEEGSGLRSAEADDSQEHRCHVCDLTFLTSFLLREHMQLHTGVRPYCCAECGKQFCHLVNYRVHLRSHAQVSSIYCLICTATFATQKDLKKHLDTNHLEDEFYQCDFCKRIFSNMEECKNHVESHQQEEKRHGCPKCERSFRHQRHLLRHLDWHKKAVLVCTDCGQVFSKKAALLRHSFYHLGLLPYTCVRCKRHFRLPSLYRQHECKPDNIQCVACLVVFQSQEDFENHKKNTGCWGHQTALPAKSSNIRCMECGQTFDSAEDLKKHVGTHQRVMKCSECGMGFRSSLMLMSHMGGHAAQRPCLCQKCGMGFCHQQDYDSHLKTCGIVTPSEASTKKPKTKAFPTVIPAVTIAPKANVLQTLAVLPSNGISHVVPLNSVAPLGIQVSSSQGLSRQTMDKQSLQGGPVVMLLPVTPTFAPESVQTPQYIVSSGVSENHLPTPYAINVPLATVSSSVIAQPERSVPLQDVTSPRGNILVPLSTNGSSTKMTWTVVEDQHTPASLPKIFTNGQNLAELRPSVNTAQVSAENSPKFKLLITPGISNTVPRSIHVEPTVMQRNTAVVEPGYSETSLPLCLVKGDSKLEYGNSSQIVVMKSVSPLINHNPNAVNIAPKHPIQVTHHGNIQIKKQPELQDRHKVTESVVPSSSGLITKYIVPSESGPVDMQSTLKLADKGTVVSTPGAKKGVLRFVHIYPTSFLSRRLNQSSPPSAVPSKKLNLGTGL